MLTTLLVPLDGSQLSERAIPYAQALARHSGARVVLVRALLAGHGAADREAARLEMDEAREELNEVAAHLRQGGVQTRWVRVNDEAGWAIVTATQEEQADLIVMSTHGRTGLGRWLYGSVAERVLHSAAVPVLLVPQHVTFNWPADPASMRIVVPLDGTLAAQAALDPAATLAKAMGGELILTRAFGPPLVAGVSGAPASYDPVEAAETARNGLALLVAQLTERGIRSDIYVGDGEAPDVILDAARDHHAHLIAMATHGRSGLARLVMGSVADAVLRRTPVALLLARPSAAAVEETEPWTSSEAEEGRTSAPEASAAESPVAILMTLSEIDLTHQAIARALEAGTVEAPAVNSARELLDRLEVARRSLAAPIPIPEAGDKRAG